MEYQVLLTRLINNISLTLILLEHLSSIVKELHKIERDDGSLLIELFREKPDKKYFPDYYNLISKPLSFKVLVSLYFVSLIITTTVSNRKLHKELIRNYTSLLMKSSKILLLYVIMQECIILINHWFILIVNCLELNFITVHMI